MSRNTVVRILINLLLIEFGQVKAYTLEDLNVERVNQGMPSLDFVHAETESPVVQLAKQMSIFYHSLNQNARNHEFPSNFSAVVRYSLKNGTVNTFVCNVSHKAMVPGTLPKQTEVQVGNEAFDSLMASLEATNATTPKDSLLISPITANPGNNLKFTTKDDNKAFFEVLRLTNNSAQTLFTLEYSELFHPSSTGVEVGVHFTNSGNYAFTVLAYVHDVKAEEKIKEMTKKIQNFQQLWHAKNPPVKDQTSVLATTEFPLLETVANEYASLLLQEETKRMQSPVHDANDEKERNTTFIQGTKFKCTYFLVPHGIEKVLEDVMNKIEHCFNPELSAANVRELIEKAKASDGCNLSPYLLLFGKRSAFAAASNNKLSIVAIVHDFPKIPEAGNTLQNCFDVLTQYWKVNPLKFDFSFEASDVALNLINSELVPTSSEGPQTPSPILKEGTCGVFSVQNGNEYITYIHYTYTKDAEKKENNGDLILKVLIDLDKFQNPPSTMDQTVPTASIYSYFKSKKPNSRRGTIPEDMLYALFQIGITKVGFAVQDKPNRNGHISSVVILRAQTIIPLLTYYGTQVAILHLDEWRRSINTGGLAPLSKEFDTHFIDQKLCLKAMELGDTVMKSGVAFRCGTVDYNSTDYFAASWNFAMGSSIADGIEYMNEEQLKLFINDTGTVLTLTNLQYLGHSKLSKYEDFARFSVEEPARDDHELQLFTELVQAKANKVSFVQQYNATNLVITLIWKCNTKSLAAQSPHGQPQENTSSSTAPSSPPEPQNRTDSLTGYESSVGTKQEPHQPEPPSMLHSEEMARITDTNDILCPTMYEHNHIRLKQIRQNDCGQQNCGSSEFQELDISKIDIALKQFLIDHLPENDSSPPNTGLGLILSEDAVRYVVTYGLYRESQLPNPNSTSDPAGQALDMLIQEIEKCQASKTSNLAELALTLKSLESLQSNQLVQVLKGISHANLCHFVATNEPNLALLVYNHNGTFLAAAVSYTLDANSWLTDVLNCLRLNPTTAPRINANYNCDEDPDNIFQFGEFEEEFHLELLNEKFETLLPLIRVGLGFMLVNQTAGKIPLGLTDAEFTYKKLQDCKVEGFLHFRFSYITEIPANVWLKGLKHISKKQHNLDITLEKLETDLITLYVKPKVDLAKVNGFWISDVFAMTVHTTASTKPIKLIENFLDESIKTQPGLGNVDCDTEYVCVHDKVSTLDIHQLTSRHDGGIDIAAVTFGDDIKLLIVSRNWSVQRVVFSCINTFRPKLHEPPITSVNQFSFNNNEELGKKFATIIGDELQHFTNEEDMTDPFGLVINDNYTVTFKKSTELHKYSGKTKILSLFIRMIGAITKNSDEYPEDRIKWRWIATDPDFHTIQPAASTKIHMDLMSGGCSVQAISFVWKHGNMILLVAYSTPQLSQSKVLIGGNLRTRNLTMQTKAEQLAKIIYKNKELVNKAGFLVMNYCVAVFASYSRKKDLAADDVNFVITTIHQNELAVGKRVKGPTVSRLPTGTPSFLAAEHPIVALQHFSPCENTVNRVYGSTAKEFGSFIEPGDAGDDRGVVVLFLSRLPRGDYLSFVEQIWGSSVLYSTPLEFIANEIWAYMSTDHTRYKAYGIGELNDAKNQVRFVFHKRTLTFNPENSTGEQSILAAILKIINRYKVPKKSGALGKAAKTGKKIFRSVKRLFSTGLFNSGDKYITIRDENIISEPQLAQINKADIVGIWNKAVQSGTAKKPTWTEIGVIAYSETIQA